MDKDFDGKTVALLELYLIERDNSRYFFLLESQWVIKSEKGENTLKLIFLSRGVE